jgi:hypothetical protein
MKHGSGGNIEGGGGGIESGSEISENEMAALARAWHRRSNGGISVMAKMSAIRRDK